MVTGAQGCIGSWVVKQLLERGQEFTVPVIEAGVIAPTLVQSGRPLRIARPEHAGQRLLPRQVNPVSRAAFIRARNSVIVLAPKIRYGVFA